MNSRVLRSRHLFAVGALALLGGLSVSACSSDPTPKRVALDMVETLEDVSETEQQCMIDKIEEDYTGEELEAIGDATKDSFDFEQRNANEGDQADALNAFIDDLQSCRRQ